jgi:diacylglycerol kinase family enzyme
MGGDGELFDCLNGMAGVQGAELAVVPYGRTNEFIHAFGNIKPDALKNLDALIPSNTLETDVISCEGKYALNYCAVGLEVASSAWLSRMTDSVKNLLVVFPFLTRLYRLYFFLATIMNRQRRQQEYTIKIDGEDYSGVYVSINIANGPGSKGNKSVSPDAVPNDGLLEIALLKPAGLTTILTYGGYRRGRTPPNCIRLKGKNITIQSARALQMELDGELFFTDSAQIEVLPGYVPVAAFGYMSYGGKTGNENG